MAKLAQAPAPPGRVELAGDRAEDLGRLPVGHAGPAGDRADVSAGHGAGKPAAKAIAEDADRLAFLGAPLGTAPG